MSWLLVSIPLLALLVWLALRTRPTPDELPDWDRLVPVDAAPPAPSPESAPEHAPDAEAGAADPADAPVEGSAADQEPTARASKGSKGGKGSKGSKKKGT